MEGEEVQINSYDYQSDTYYCTLLDNNSEESGYIPADVLEILPN